MFRNKSKYGAKKVEYKGLIFDSRAEYRRYLVLKDFENKGIISDLKNQVKFELIPSQKLGKKVIERPCNYLADFVYFDNKSGIIVVEDVKSKATITPEYVIKRKLMLHIHGIKINEVFNK